MAISAAREAGMIILKYYNNNYHIRDKGFSNPVTTADTEADTFLGNTILAEFPGDGWLSEETKDSTERLSKQRVWVVDPLDGTIEFIRGIPEFVVSVALTIDREPVVGVIYNPLTKEMFSAMTGSASRLNGNEIHCSANTELHEATVYVSRSETKSGLWKPFEDMFKMLIVSGSIANKLVHTAANYSDLTISLRPKNEWDICAADLIVRNAGGLLINRDLNPIRYNSENPFIPNGLIAGPPQLLEKVKPLFKI
ncbi:MAG: 3'(2'),5'-bisphosphate nucleotidase CysQ [bacterium]